MRRLRSDLSLSAVCAGFVAMAVSYAGPMLVIVQAASQAGLAAQQTASWVWAVSVGSGVTGLLLSLLTRQPVIVAWSVPGAALLLTTLGDYSFAEAIGAYLVAAALGLALSLSGLLGWLLATVPRPILSAVLAGVLLPFVMELAPALVQSPLVAGAVALGYILARRRIPGFAVPVALAAGVLAALAAGQLAVPALSLALTKPVLTLPEFSLPAILGISVPLLIVTMAGQNGPGLAMLRSGGFAPNDRLLLAGGSLASLLFAPFGSHAINLAAITAGICTSPESHRDPARRYIAGISCGAFFVVFGLFSEPILQLFAAVPPQLISAVAAVALIAALQGSLSEMFHADGRQPAAIEAAVLTLAVTASGISPWGIVAPFWAVLVGSGVYLVLRTGAPRPAPKRQPAEDSKRA